MLKTAGIALVVALISLAVVGLIISVSGDLFTNEDKGVVNAEIDVTPTGPADVKEDGSGGSGTGNVKITEIGGAIEGEKGKFYLIEPKDGAVVVNVNSCCPSSGCGEVSVQGCDCYFDYRFDPVCGTDGNTYINEYGAKMAGVGVAYKGYCEDKPNFGVIKPEPKEEGCYDSDGGDNPKQAGYVKLGDQMFKDECTLQGELNAQREYFCKAGDVDSKTYICQQGCTGGVCNEYLGGNTGMGVIDFGEDNGDTNTGGNDGFVVLPDLGCYDSDGGDDPSTPGYVTYQGKRYEDSCSVDGSKPYVGEWSCDENGEPKLVLTLCDGPCYEDGNTGLAFCTPA